MAQEYAKAFYHSKEWLKCKSAFMKSKHGLCEQCGSMAYIVHHKKHITPMNIHDPEITLSWDNLQALCLTCHNVAHGSDGACAEGLSFDSEGNLVKSPRSQSKNEGVPDRLGNSRKPLHGLLY